MQIRLHAKNTFVFIMAVGFIYLAYLIFFESGDGMPEIDVDLKDVISYAVLAAEMGGHAVEKLYREQDLNIKSKGLTKEGKEDLRTDADLLSNFLILDVLRRFPQLRIVSEEKADDRITEKRADRYRSDNYEVWSSVKSVLDKMPSRRLQLSDVSIYVDPLDATQEYTEGLTEYVTVMTCICNGDEPIFGAIYRPFHNETIFGLVGWGVMTSSGKKLTRASLPKKDERTVVVSRSHSGKNLDHIIRESLGDNVTVEPAGGSGYKVLRLINGTAELYMHSTIIKKWDTCAGDAILRAMGGSMMDLRRNPLRYSPEEGHVNKYGLLATLNDPAPYFDKFDGKFNFTD